jgi:hypothetical protein
MSRIRNRPTSTTRTRFRRGRRAELIDKMLEELEELRTLEHNSTETEALNLGSEEKSTR